ncbi:MAG: S1 family peptidase [Pirellulaceae bacterium]
MPLLSPTPTAWGKWPWEQPDAPPPTPHPAVVRVLAEDPDGMAQGSGTLVEVREQFGMVVTNWHVVRNASGAVNVIFPDGFRSAARVLQVDRDWDLAALLIWRPKVVPVPLAGEAPRPGDPLTIAGYGTGVYRTAPGQCTQYLAPGTDRPFEIVEVSTAARQGDSGGPIFNARGELAGVLFGSDGGSTSGSYAGRVREFLLTAWESNEKAGDAHERVAANPPRDVNRQLQRLPEVAAASPLEDPTLLTPLPLMGTANRLDPARAQPPARASSETELAPVSSSAIAWEDFAGKTTYQQVKTVLAIIGLAAVFMQLTRFKQPQS